METSHQAHCWTATSRHATSEGPITYERCPCGQWRIRRETPSQLDQTIALAPARSPGVSATSREDHRSPATSYRSTREAP
jgi:hypothetical protein